VKPRIAIIVAAAIAILFLGGIHPFISLTNYQKRIQENVENEIRSNVHPGDTRAQVEGYLTREGIDHSFAELLDGGRTVPMELATTRGAGRYFFRRINVHIIFNFDRDDKLENFTTQEQVVVGI
jgi:hypothetical protein